MPLKPFLQHLHGAPGKGGREGLPAYRGDGKQPNGQEVVARFRDGAVAAATPEGCGRGYFSGKKRRYGYRRAHGFFLV